MTERDTPRRLPLPSATVDIVEGREAGNGNRPHEHRDDVRETQWDRVERVVLETYTHLGHLARAQEMSRARLERMEVAARSADANAELHRGETKRLADSLAAVQGEIGGLRADFSAITRLVGVSRTISGQMAAVIPPMTVRTLGRSDTGEHQKISDEQVEAINAQLAAQAAAVALLEQRARDAEAEERGAREALRALEQADDDRDKVRKAARELWQFRVAIGGAAFGIVSFLSTAAYYLVTHLHP
jgi:chromosome segregation ATPase